LIILCALDLLKKHQQSVLVPLPGRKPVSVIPRFEIVKMKPPYVYPGCFIHTYCNNTINRCHIQ
jgi:hypothetical protein